MSHTELKTRLEAAWDARDSLDKTSPQLRADVEAAINLLDKGEARVAEPVAVGPSEAQHPAAPTALGHPAHRWQVNEWLKKAVLLSFRLNDNALIDNGPGAGHWFDKVPSKFSGWSEGEFRDAGFRAVPGSVVRRGAFIGKGAILMPSFVNIGAYVGEGTMVDTWATVGSCAQIGKNVHLSGGAGIGGVLEPLQADPVIIGDGAFIGARSEVAEGVRVGEGAVLSMGVYLGASTKIIDRATGETFIGEVPPYAVVVPGSTGGGNLGLYCAVIVKRVDERTRSKTSINELLRD
jgi:2,3,4,5-tetrahydropyridine-2-carboxylate N-succinyltransferase